MSSTYRWWICSAALVLTFAFPPTGAHAQGKRVYISVDMEGIRGVSGDDQITAGAAEYGRSRKLMAADANAAIEGARLAGATDIVVNDSHGGQRNLLPEDLAPGVRLITHTFKRHGMMEGLDESFDAVLFAATTPRPTRLAACSRTLVPVSSATSRSTVARWARAG